ncbi:MAG: carbohydrate-binding domain-containing protein [Bacteroidales bacterium]|nr:carbohydrate-binding domain-containing protein [Bacteroidales bacterium]
MKRYILLIFAAEALLTAACSEDAVIETPQDENLTEVVLTAGWDTASRVTLGTGLKPEWEDSDAIAIYDGTDVRKFTISSNYGSSATFTGSMDTSAGTWYAAYPYDAVTGFSNSQKRFITSIPSAQTVAAGDSLDTSALISTCAFTDTDNVYFLQATSLVAFTISVSGITQVELSSNGGEYLAGDLVQIRAEDATIRKFSSYSTKVTMTHASGVFPTGTYYLAVVPNTFASGLTMSLSKSGASASISSTSSVTTVQGGGISLGDVTDGVTFDESKYTISTDDAGDTSDEDIVDNTTFVRKIYVTFSSSGSATVTGAGSQAVTISGNDVTIDNTGTNEKVIYELSGTTGDGFFKVYSDNKQALVLNGVSITNKSGAAINNQGGKRCFVNLKGTNTLSDSSSASYSTSSDEDMKGVFFSEGQLIFSGSGSLTVTANNTQGKSGIVSDDYVRMMSSPSVTVTAGSSAGHGIKVNEFVQLSKGTLSVTTAAAMKKGIASDDYVLVEGGTTTIKVSGGTAYDSEDAEYKGTAGIKADNYFAMTGGSVTITNSGAGGKGVHAGSYDYDATSHIVADSYISGGTLTITTTGSESNDVSTKGMKIGWAIGTENRVTASDGSLLISGGVVKVSSSKSEGIESKDAFTMTGGELYVTSSGDDAVNCAGEMKISGGYVYANSSKNDALDSNGNMTLSGGYIFAVTTAGDPEVAIDCAEQKTLTIANGVTLVAYPKIESGAKMTQTCYKMTCTAGSWNALYGSSYIAAFKAPSGVSSVIVSAPSLSKGYKSVSVGSTTFCNGIWATSGISGGSSVSLSTYSGGGGGPGGRP